MLNYFIMIPDFEISLGGTDRTATIRPLLEAIDITDKAGLEADTAEITLKFVPNLAIPDGSADCVIKLGYKETGVGEVFKGVINRDGFRGPPDRYFIQATGVGLSDDKRLQGSTTRSWNEPLTLGQVLIDIIQGAGFKARVHGDLSGIELKRMIQSIETDIEILSKLATDYGATLKSDGDTVAVVPRGNLERADGQKLDPVSINRTACSKYSWTRRRRNAYKSVVAFYQSEEDGATQAVIKGSGKPEKRLKQIYQTQAGAEMAAQEELNKVKRVTQVNLTFPGRFIAVGSPLQVSGFPERVNGTYQVKRVTHSYGKGYVTTIEAEGE